ncbi:MAG TPA: dienelactone hydrolase family protein, partial [Candidatus Brocadiia bacterium]|nr:dienelactone hydrolase family protein [Candidatus Brocadiia bacterium]
MSLKVLTAEEQAWARGMLHDGMDEVAQGAPLLPGARSKAAWLARREAVRRRMWETLGIRPSETCDLEPRVLGVSRRGDLCVERVVIQTRPGCPLPMNLYRPMRLKGPAAAVLFAHGHSPHGKAQEEYQRALMGLARLGYVALSYDMVGYNEREGMGHRLAYGPLAAGGAVMGMIVWDGMKALDYLLSRPEVDPGRVGCTGNSGGGTQTLLLAALDERIAAAAPAGYGSTYGYNAAKERHICACNMLPSFLSFAEMDDLYACIAPRPLLINQGMDDRLFPFDSVRRVFRRARRVYRLLGVEERVKLSLAPCGHPYDQPKREAMYEWFNRFLRGMGAASTVKEPATRPFAEDGAELRCFAKGRLPAGAATVDELARRDALAVLAGARERLEGPGGVERARKALVEALGLRGRRAKVVKVEDRGEAVAGRCSWRKLLVWVSEGVALPCALFEPCGPVRGAAVVADSRGKDTGWARAAARRLVGRGLRVAAVDLRGWGETRG